MKLFAFLCVFVTIAYASAASVDGPSYEMRRINERDADPDAYADAVADAFANAIARAGADADAFADPNVFADPNAVANPDDNVRSRPRRFNCPFRSGHSFLNRVTCTARCRIGNGRTASGVCQNGVCVCR